LARGEPAGWLVNAPPGAGKTRLVDELEARALADGHPVWRATVAEGERTGYGAVAQLLRVALGIGVDDGDVDADGRGGAGDEPAVPAALTERFRAAGWAGTRAAVAAEHVAAVLTGQPLDADPGDLHPSWIAALDLAAAGR